MQISSRCAVVLFIVMAVFSTAMAQNASSAPDNAALMQKIRDLEDRVIALEGQIRTMKEQQAPAPAAAAPSTSQPPTTQVAGAQVATPTPQPQGGVAPLPSATST